MKIAILGFGREGKSTLAFLQKSKVLKGDEVWILDKNPHIKIPKGARARLGKNCFRSLTDFDLAFRSPGIPWNLPDLARARRAGVRFSSGTKLFFKHCSAAIIGITGTKGKGTTAMLLCNILKKARKKVFLAGNIGTPALDILPRLTKKSLVILELSSFQLQDLDVSPHIAVVLDMFPDHQDSHRNLKEYYEAKANIARNQNKYDKIFYFVSNAVSRQIALQSRGQKIAVNPHISNSRELENMIRKAVRIPGEHNFKNAIMAAMVARSLGVKKTAIRKAVMEFTGNEHRLEFVRRIRVHPRRNPRESAIYFYNDSASTNPRATEVAIRAFPGKPKVLIAGGRDKNLKYEYASLAKTLENSGAKLVILLGENKNKIARTIDKESGRWRVEGGKVKLVKNLEEAVKISYDYALHSTLHDPHIVIFSPGAKSFDMFKNYEARGAAFKKTVKQLR